MNPPLARLIAWGSLALSGIAAVITLALLLARQPAGISIAPQLWVFAFSFTGFSLVGALVAARRPRNPLGWLFCAVGLLMTLSSFGSEYGLQARSGILTGWPAAVFSLWFANLVVPPGTGLLIFIVLLFPNGRLPSPRWRPLAWAAALFLTGSTIFGAVYPAPLTGDLGSTILLPYNPYAIEAVRVFAAVYLIFFPAFAAMLTLAAVSMVLRLRRSTGEERQQLKLFGFAAVVLALAAVSSAVIDNLPPLAALKPDEGLIGAVGMVTLATATGLAILRYRLYEVDVAISRTVTYAALALLITATYLGVAVGIGSLVGRGNSANLLLSVVATAIVALAFQPVRSRLNRLANRLVYGRRASPYEVLSQMSHRVAEAYGADLLPRMAQVLGEGTGATRAEVWLRLDEELRREAAWPSDGAAPPSVPVDGADPPSIPGATRVVAVRHAGELLGALALVVRPGASLSPIEVKLVADLASEAGLVLRNIALTEELRRHVDALRASRQRLVTAQDAERRRLERNLHDGAQQNLVALRVKLSLARSLALRDPGKVATALADLDRDAAEAIDTLRDLARGIYPPLLADEGLGPALAAQARKATVQVNVSADGIGRYAPEVEATIYFCCLEALQNVQKYAKASCATVSLVARDGQLRFTVQDDGAGFDLRKTPTGAGLRNLADRLDALGGTFRVDAQPGSGTRVSGDLPAVPLR